MFGRAKNSVRVTEAHRMATEDGYTIVDVRTAGERQVGHPPGSIHIEMDNIPTQVARLQDVRVLAFCRSGNRSRQVVRFLTAQGIDATNVQGGIIAWQRASLPLTAGS